LLAERTNGRCFAAKPRPLAFVLMNTDVLSSV